MENTHTSNHKNIIISKNMSGIFDFLIEIEKEVKSFLNQENQLKLIHSQVHEFTGLMKEMARVIEKNELNFNFQMTENPETIVEKLRFQRFPRSEMIVLFAYLETMRTLWSAYEKKTSNKKKLRDASDQTIDNFLLEFCLSPRNKWVKSNPKRSGKISVEKLRILRNSLTHFFSVDSLGIGPNDTKEIIKLSNRTNHKAQFICSNDLLEILEGAFQILIEKWSYDSLNSSDEFKKRIFHVNKLVKDQGAKIMQKMK